MQSCLFSDHKQADKSVWEDNKELLKNAVEIVKNNSHTKDREIISYPNENSFYGENNFLVEGNVKEGNFEIKFYTDRGLLDHFSAIVYASGTYAKIYDENVKNRGNDFKLEQNWYAIND